MAARRKARIRAVEVLYEADVRGADPVTTLANRIDRARTDADEPPVREYTITLVEGVNEHRQRIDELIATYSVGWTLDRMPAVDRNILRVGAYELLWNEEVPDAVALSEAVTIAREMSTEDSPGFVNGLLARLLELKPTLVR